jgi:AcrR family transcriptional regulator
MARPRDPDIDRRILEAASALLAEAAYEDFSMNEVARRARVSRPTVYRRWSSPAHLAFEATMTTVLEYPPPDNGVFRDDLVEATLALVQMFQHMDRTLMADRFHQMMLHADFSAQVDEQFLQPGLRQIRMLWDRALQRGEVRSDLDPIQVFEDLTGVLVYRIFILHRQVALPDVEALVDQVLRSVQVS